MKPADEIRKLFKSAELGIDPNADEKVFEDVFGAHKETTENAPAMPEIWRILMKNRKAQFTAAAVVVLAVYLCLQIPKSLVAPAYALQETIEAYNSIRTLHVKAFKIVYGQRFDSESWIEFDEYGKPARFRYETNRVWTGDEIGPVTCVQESGGSDTWLTKHHLCFRRSGKSVLGGALLQWEVSDSDPKRVIEKLRRQAGDGEIILDVNVPDQKNEPIVLVVTYPAESRSANWKKVLYIDQATRLVKEVENFEMQDGQYQHIRTAEFLDYNQPIDPEMFNLEGELPNNVVVIDQSGKEVGLAQGDMTDMEIAVEVTQQFLRAWSANDSDKVGQLFLGAPGFLVEKYFGGGEELKIISVGPAHRSSTPDSNAMTCPCKILGEHEGQYYENNMKMGVVPVPGQPGRWMIGGFEAIPKPVSGDMTQVD
ncbi:MAG: hypothetical protein ACYS0H_27055 [Planctomycetota bacterium]|jgi:hypothetical protein